ncbi:MAG: hypothetical protein AAGA62_06130 [Bacteroidota bacterium]
MSDVAQPENPVLRELSARVTKLEEKASKRQKKEAAKAARKAEAAATLQQFDTATEPRKSLSTFLRNQNKLYVNAINVIDRKAAIMIRVNSTIVSAILIFFQYVAEIQYGVFIGIVMIMASFSSLMLAINASRPHVFSLLRSSQKIKRKYAKPEESMFVLGAHAKISLEEYQAAFEQVVNNQSLQIGNQVRTMYLFEQQQIKSFTRIELAYLAFMAGFSISVLTFLVGVIQSVLL